MLRVLSIPGPVSCRCPEPKVVCWRPHLTGKGQYIQKGGKIQAPACSVSGKGPSLRLNNFSVVLTKPA